MGSDSITQWTNTEQATESDDFSLECDVQKDSGVITPLT